MSYADSIAFSAEQVHARGEAQVEVREHAIHLRIDNPHGGSGLRLAPPDGQPTWDFSGWAVLAIDLENRSADTQSRLLLELTAAEGVGTDQYANTGIALNPGEKATLRLLLPHPSLRLAPTDLPGLHTVDTAKVQRIDLFMQWPFEREQKGLVDCIITNLRLEQPVSPSQSPEVSHYLPFIDPFGQYAHGDWPEKIQDASQLKRARGEELESLDLAVRPASWNRYGGWQAGPQLEATGSFRTEKYQSKWYLVDPDGRLFWSQGLDVLSNYNDPLKVVDPTWFAEVQESGSKFYPTEIALQAKYGSADYHNAYYRTLTRRLEAWGFNTIGDWGKHDLMRLGSTPYTLQLTDYQWGWPRLRGSKLKFYDVWAPAYASHMRSLIEDQSAKDPIFKKSLTDPMCIGYFIDNELHFGNRGRLVLVDEILRCPADQPAKQELISRMQEQYGSIESLNTAWGMAYDGWEGMAESNEVPESETYKQDAQVFFVATVERYFELCRDSIKRVAPHRLYLGCRFISTDAVRPVLAAASAKYCDVLTVNIYAHSAANFPVQDMPDMPVLIGEFHFGAKGVEARGMFRPGLANTGFTQAERARAYRRFVEGALVHPNIVGAHWFQYRDQPLTGRGDGEAYQIGFVDVMDLPYTEMIEASRQIGETMYSIRQEGQFP